MINSGRNILEYIHKKWLWRFWIEIGLYGFGVSMLIYGLSHHVLASVLGFLGTVSLLTIVLKPLKYDLKHICKYLDSAQNSLEFSTSLVLKEESQLSLVARLQRDRVGKQLKEIADQLKPERSMKTSFLASSFLVILAIFSHYYRVPDLHQKSQPAKAEQPIIFKSLDSTLNEAGQPAILKQRLSVRYPSYTRQKAKYSSDMKIKELQGSVIVWELEFDKKIQKAAIQQLDQNNEMTFSKGIYSYSSKLETSGFYNFRFVDTLGNEYFSELYSIEVVQDKSPKLEVSGLAQFTSFDADEQKILSFEAFISDDYGISQASIVATVSKGSGESVKFREEKLSFDDEVKKGSRRMTLGKEINLDDMQMSPGDELYFYVEVIDVMQPKANVTRGETYFANIKDTITDVFEVESGMGVDQMPDYFRSQRQLIIDTEKLIKEKPLLSKSEFNAKSNELAFDQKALRIKYGEFMGDESTLGIDSEDEAHNEEEEENLLAEFEHAHDTENESNLVEDDHDDHEEHGEEDNETEEDPLHDYTHNHDDPEETTLHSESLKTKLRIALNEMWDAELHLRLYHPEESLPIQYRILKRLQDIKNSARIYVHRIGFDPPPIKEDKRLSGDLEEVKSYKKSAELTKPIEYPSIRTSIARIEVLKNKTTVITDSDRALFEAAGNEIGALAIAQPGRYLETLQQLKKLSQGFNMSSAELLIIQQGLIRAVPISPSTPDKLNEEEGVLNSMFIKQLAIYD